MTDRRPIRHIPADLALKIAAGEVVERPASVVKELIDNALDAGAGTIKIEVRDAGLKLIRVADDGWGIPREEVELAFQSHATSKIATMEDLERLATLGFRGEALPSIAAVSRVEMQTRQREENTGTRFFIEHGHPMKTEAYSMPTGSRITVTDLFANVPARRKFVRSLRAEAGQIATVIMHYALAQPLVRFELTVDGRVTFLSPGSGRTEEIVAAVYGPRVVSDLLAIDAEEGGIQISGLASSPQLTRQNRAAITLSVNGRPIQNRSLIFALEEAYSGFIMSNRHPLAAIQLILPAAEIDVNVHPSKSEVRFANSREVHGAVHRAIAGALMEMRMSTRSLGDTLEPALFEGSSATAVPIIDAQEAPASTPLMPELPVLRVFGQANQTFIIAEGPHGLYMIDQHAAHERILFDRFDAVLEAGGAPSQPLLQPVSVDLTPAQMQSLEENQPLLATFGFVLEPFGESTCLVRSLPGMGRLDSPADLVGGVLDELETSPEPQEAREKALAVMACKAAVKAGQTLGIEEMRELVIELERTPRPSTCPHGRPTMIHLSLSQLEREFGRR